MAEEKWNPGELLRQARVKKGLSQARLAEAMGVSRNTVLNWESGRSRPDYDELPALCAALGMQPAELFGGTADTPLSTEEKHLLSLYRGLSHGGRMVAENLMESLLREEQRKRTAELSDSFRVLAQYDSGVAAGPGCEFGDTRPSPQLYRRCERNAGADAVVRVSGDSMEPVYRDGDLLYFRYASSARPGADVVCSTIRGAVVKRLDARGELFSVNPDRPFTMKTEADNVRMLGVVTGLVAPFDLPERADVGELEEIFRPELNRFRRTYGLQDWE